jgi:acyl dehydratase
VAVRTFPVEAGHIMMFARALGDENPVYHDPVRASGTECGGIVAPPTFTVASAQFDPDYYMRPHPGQPWFGSGRTPSGGERPGVGQGTILHAEQHFEYHRPLRAGTVLTADSEPGRTWEKDSRRAGRLSFSETITRYRDADGQIVVTARMVRVTTERPVEA